jgi:hypothetical protein
LDETKNEIRIFRLYCGKATEEFVEGKLDIIELHNNQPRDYKALHMLGAIPLGIM